MKKTDLDAIKARWAKYPEKAELWAEPNGILLAKPTADGAFPAPPYEKLNSDTVLDSAVTRAAWPCLRNARRDVTALFQHIEDLNERIRKTEAAMKVMTDGFLEAASNMRKQWGREVADLQNKLARQRGQEETHGADERAS